LVRLLFCSFIQRNEQFDCSIGSPAPRHQGAAAWAARILYRAGNDERWQKFYALASALIQGRALKEIPLMYNMASQTVSAWEHRLDG
jgi:hypothetical protein